MWQTCLSVIASELKKRLSVPVSCCEKLHECERIWNKGLRGCLVVFPQLCKHVWHVEMHGH